MLTILLFEMLPCLQWDEGQKQMKLQLIFFLYFLFKLYMYCRKRLDNQRRVYMIPTIKISNWCSSLHSVGEVYLYCFSTCRKKRLSTDTRR